MHDHMKLNFLSEKFHRSGRSILPKFKDAEINISDAVLNRSGRTWGSSQKPPSTCSGPDDGYSTERGESSKTESGGRLPNVKVEMGIPTHPIGNPDCESMDGSYNPSEYRMTTERMYSTLQSGPSKFNGRFSTLQTRMPQV